jgi:hypothetical protein
MMPPMTRKASTSTSSTAITSFVLVSMDGRMMHKVALPRSGGATRRCDVDQAPRGPLARRTHLTDRKARSARCEHSAGSRPLWGATRVHARSTKMAPALEAFESGPPRGVGPTALMAIIAARRGEGQGDHAIGPTTAAKDQGRDCCTGSSACVSANEPLRDTGSHVGPPTHRAIPGPGIEPGRGFPPSGF